MNRPARFSSTMPSLAGWTDERGARQHRRATTCPAPGGEEGQDVLDEVLLAGRHGQPVLHVVRQVDLLRRPEARLRTAQRVSEPNAPKPGGGHTSCFLYILQMFSYLIGKR